MQTFIQVYHRHISLGLSFACGPRLRSESGQWLQSGIVTLTATRLSLSLATLRTGELEQPTLERLQQPSPARASPCWKSTSLTA